MKINFAPTNDPVERVGQNAANIMAEAAAEYAFGVKGLRKFSNDQADKLVAALRTVALRAIPAAFVDAREAIEAGMVQVATATFAASMKLAGIEAAKLALN